MTYIYITEKWLHFEVVFDNMQLVGGEEMAKNEVIEELREELNKFFIHSRVKSMIL